MITLISIALVLVSAQCVHAESHTIRFVNNCGYGTPTLVQAGNILSNGADYTSDGPFQSAIAYLQTGDCLLNGEHCTLVEMNMNNPTCAGCGPSVDLSLIPSHAFNVETAFAFYGGDGDVCDGLGAVCADATCNTAFFNPDDNQVQRACQADNVNLLITFCGGGTTEFTEAIVGSLSGESSSASSFSSKSASPSLTTATSFKTTTLSTITSSSSSSKASSSSSPSFSAASPSATKTHITALSSPVTSSTASPTAVENVGLSSDGDKSISTTSTLSSLPSSSAPSPSTTKTCKRQRYVKRAESFAKHARSQARAHTFSGVHAKF